MTFARADELIRQNSVEVSDKSVPKEPIVSVRIITYNHAPFIAEAIESVLMQQVDFPYEIVIGDDHSTDGTTQIVLEYQKRHADKIRVLLANENLGKFTDGNARLNYYRSLTACRGEFIALLEGDDYWVDARKLQKQVELMRAEPKITLCGTRVQWPSADLPTQINIFPAGPRPAVFCLDEIVARNRMHTCTLMLRKELIPKLPEWWLRAPIADHPLLIFAALQGKVAFLDAVTGYYRVHANGIWSLRNAIHKQEATLEIYELVRPHVPADCWRKATCLIFAETGKLFGPQFPFRGAYYYLLSFRSDPRRIKRLCAAIYYLGIGCWRWCWGWMFKTAKGRETQTQK